MNPMAEKSSSTKPATTSAPKPEASSGSTGSTKKKELQGLPFSEQEAALAPPGGPGQAKLGSNPKGDATKDGPSLADLLREAAKKEVRFLRSGIELAFDAVRDDVAGALAMHDELSAGAGGGEATYRSRSQDSAKVLRRAADEVARSRRVAKIRGFETGEYGLFAEVAQHAEDLETYLEEQRSSYEAAYAVPDAPSRMRGFPKPVADELERVREPIATVLRIAAAMPSYRSAPGNEEKDAEKLAGATDGKGARGDGSYLAEAMFRGAQPLAFIRAFVVAARMSLADFPVLAHEALALEQDGGEEVVLADAVNPLIDSLEARTSTRWQELPRFANVDETVLYAAITRIHNHLVDFRVARARLASDEVQAGDFELLTTAPEEAASDWGFVKQAKGLPSASMKRLTKHLDEAIATARAEGRMEVMMRQGFIEGESDIEEVMGVLDTTAGQVVQSYDAAIADARHAAPGVAVTPSRVDAVRRYLAKVNASQSAKDRLATAQKEGVVPKTIEKSGLPKDIIGILQSVTSAGVETAKNAWVQKADWLDQAIRQMPFDTGADGMPNFAGRDINLSGYLKEYEAGLELAHAKTARLETFAKHLDKVGAVGDILSVATGIYQMATATNRTELVSGAIDAASGAVGLGLFALSKSSSSLAVGAGAAAAPVAFMFAYVKLVHESLGKAYSQFRKANAGLRSQEIDAVLDAMDNATAAALRGAAAAKLVETDKDPTSQSVFGDAILTAIKNTLAVDDACRVLVNPAQRSETDPLAELTEVSALYSGWDEERTRLGFPYTLATTPAVALLASPPKDLTGKAERLNKHGATIIGAAGTLASGAAEWVSSSLAK